MCKISYVSNRVSYHLEIGQYLSGLCICSVLAVIIRSTSITQELPVRLGNCMSHHTSGIFSQLFVYTVVYKDLIDVKFKMLFGYFALCMCLNTLRKIALQWRHKQGRKNQIASIKGKSFTACLYYEQFCS